MALIVMLWVSRNRFPSTSSSRASFERRRPGGWSNQETQQSSASGDPYIVRMGFGRRDVSRTICMYDSLIRGGVYGTYRVWDDEYLCYTRCSSECAKVGEQTDDVSCQDTRDRERRLHISKATNACQLFTVPYPPWGHRLRENNLPMPGATLCTACWVRSAYHLTRPSRE